MYGIHTLAFQRIFVRMKIISLIFIRFSYVSLIRNGVTGPLDPHNMQLSDCMFRLRSLEKSDSRFYKIPQVKFSGTLVFKCRIPIDQ